MIATTTATRPMSDRPRSKWGKRLRRKTDAELLDAFEECGWSRRKVEKKYHVCYRRLADEMNRRGLAVRRADIGRRILAQVPKAALLRTLLANAWSTTKAGAEYGVTGPTVSHECARRGIRLVKGSRPAVHWDPDVLRELYWTRSMTLRQIGHEAGVLMQSVHAAMVKYGIPRRKVVATDFGRGHKVVPPPSLTREEMLARRAAFSRRCADATLARAVGPDALEEIRWEE